MERAQDNIDKEGIVPVSAALILFFGIGACLGPITASFVIYPERRQWSVTSILAVNLGVNKPAALVT